MRVELEYKLHAGHPVVREKLRAAGAAFVSRVLETNRLFDRDDEGLHRAGCGLRVRSVQALEGPPPPATLTYKGPRTPGPFKRREEIEVEIDDATAMTRLLTTLGYRERIVFEKRRESWLLGPCRVELDELPTLGCFVEIEGPDEATIRASLAMIGLAEAPAVTETYVALVAAVRDKDPTGPIALRFERK